MPRVPTAIPMTGVELDRGGEISLTRQLYDRLRSAILSGQLVGGFRLPSTRTLATELGVSRNTVIRVYDQLQTEGYITVKTGSGAMVTRVLPESLLNVPSAGAEPGTSHLLAKSARPRPPSRRASPHPGPSRLGELLAESPSIAIAAARLGGWTKAFQTGTPALDHFPAEIWARLVSRHLRDPSTAMLAYGSPAGHPPLRMAIAAYLGASRGVQCTAEQVIIVGGAQSGLDLAARTLLDPGDTAWVEDPGYVGARAALMASGAELVPVPVDGNGLDVSAGEARGPDARMVIVTPGHHYPLGSSMSLPRRHQLLDWATRTGAWIVEDDYDGEFRYAGRPLAALQSLRPDGPVIYIGTFSKILFPALRIGYLVVPPDLIRHFIAVRLAIDVTAPTLEQVALTDFIAEGHFARHIRRMRTLYARRATTLVAAARRELRGLLDVQMPTSGMNTLGMLPLGVDDREAARRAAANDVTVLPLSRCSIEPIERGGLLLGFASADEDAIQTGIRRLADALRPLVRE